jgi:hypothetical protein
MIANIVDSRTNKYNIECDAAFEPSFHDNECEGATQFEKPREGFAFSSREVLYTTVKEAVTWAFCHNGYITVYLYDRGSLSVSKTSLRLLSRSKYTTTRLQPVYEDHGKGDYEYKLLEVIVDDNDRLLKYSEWQLPKISESPDAAIYLHQQIIEAYEKYEAINLQDIALGMKLQTGKCI